MPDSKTAVLVGHDVVVFDVATRSPLRRFPGHANGMESVAVSPDGKTIATGGFIDLAVELWDAATGARVRGLQIAKSPGGAHGVSGLAYTPDGKRIAAAYRDQRLATFDTTTGALAWADSFTPGAAGPVSVAVSADGKLIAAAAGTDGVAVWDAATGRQMWTSKEGATSVAFQGGSLASVGRSTGAEPLVIFDARTGAVKEVRRKEHGQLAKVAALPGRPGAYVVAEHGSAVTIWDEHGPASMYAHLDGLVDVAVSPDGRYAASVALDDGVRVWDLGRGSEVLVDGHASAVVALAASADGARLTSVGNDGSILVRSVPSGTIVSRREGPRSPIVAAAFSASGDVGVIASEVPDWWPAATGPGVYVVDGRTAQVRAELEFRFLPATAVALSADGRGAVAFGSGLWGLFDLTGLATRKTLPPVASGDVAEVKAEVQAAALLPDGDVAIVSGSRWYAWEAGYGEQAGIVGRLHLADRQPVWSLKGGVMTRLAATPDGATALAGDRSGTVRLVDLRSGKLRWPMSLQWKGSSEAAHPIIAVALSPDGRFAAATDTGGTLRVWNVDSGLLHDTVTLPAATALAFAPDSRSLYAGGANGVVFRFAL